MNYDDDAPRTPPRNDRTNSYTELNAPFTPASVATSLVPTVVDDMSQYRIDEIANQANRHEQSRLYKKVPIRDMIILNQLGQVVDDLYKLVQFTYHDKRLLRDGLWDDHIYNMHGENITGQNARERRRGGGKRTHKKNSKKNNSKNNKRSSKKNNSKK